jgi:predicted Zn-dependent protease
MMKSSPAVALSVILSVAAATVVPFRADAQVPARAPQIVRDAETESLLADYARPVFRAAGLRSDAAQIILINDRRFNAFVVSGSRMFINTGALVDAETPGEIIGVIAHETGHIAGGHLVRLRDAAARAQTLAAIGMVIGAAGAAAGAVAGSGSSVQAGAATAMGAGAFAQRSFLAYVRTEEMSADRAAVTYLEKTRQSAAGMLTTFRRFANEVLLSQQGVDPYLMSHPMPQERLSQLETLARKSPFFATKDPPALQARHDLMRAKIVAFTGTPNQVVRLYPANDASLPARYARAILAMRTRAPAEAVTAIDGLIAAAPVSPWFHELKGQALLEAGRPAAAVAPLRRAVDLAPAAGQLRIMLGRALVATEDRGRLDEAIAMLNAAATRDTLDSGLYRTLARAYGLKNDPAKADLMVARGLVVDGDIGEARKYAARAQRQFKTGSADWLLADDIVSQKPDKP